MVLSDLSLTCCSVTIVQDYTSFWVQINSTTLRASSRAAVSKHRPVRSASPHLLAEPTRVYQSTRVRCWCRVLEENRIRKT